MGFKKIDPKISFAEFAPAASIKKNRNLKTLEQINREVLKQLHLKGLTINEGIASTPGSLNPLTDP